jgi:hypothetical protein
VFFFFLIVLESSFWHVVNIVQEKRVRKFSKDFASTTWINEKMTRIFVFHTAMMIVFNTKTSEFEIKTTSSSKFHINNLSKLSLHWRVMLRHSHAEEFLKAAQMKYDVIEMKRTWKIIDKKNDYKLISLKWVFIYKSDSNDFLFKYKARIVIRDDLQKVNNAQNVYVATFASKIFRIMMIFRCWFSSQNYTSKKRELNRISEKIIQFALIWFMSSLYELSYELMWINFWCKFEFRLKIIIIFIIISRFLFNHMLQTIYYRLWFRSNRI